MSESGLERLRGIMARLRDPERGCPWDREQDLTTLVPFTIEEAYEVADAVERGDLDELREELGDLLFQVVFYARIAEEAGQFDLDDVIAGIAGKLIRRHPHVFGDAEVDSVAGQSRAWEAHKAEERRSKGGATDVFSGVALALPALTRAVKLQRRAARVGFDWPDRERVLEKVGEELGELHAEIEGGDAARLDHEIGDLLLAVSNLARHLDIDPEGAVRRANRRFQRRYRRMETLAAAAGGRLEDASLEEMEAFWRRAKAEEGGG